MYKTFKIIMILLLLWAYLCAGGGVVEAYRAAGTRDFKPPTLSAEEWVMIAIWPAILTKSALLYVNRGMNT